MPIAYNSFNIISFLEKWNPGIYWHFKFNFIPVAYDAYQNLTLKRGFLSDSDIPLNVMSIALLQSLDISLLSKSSMSSPNASYKMQVK